MRKACAAAVVLLTVGPTTALAEDTAPLLEGVQEIEQLSLDDLLNLTVTAVSRREERVFQAPATVTVITRRQFEEHAYRNVAEALRSVPGLFVSWGRDYYYTGVRGVAFPRDVDSHLLVLLDGHTLNNPWSGASNTGEVMTLPVDAIERVEVIRGPSSSIYGSNAFFAVVNIVSRRPAEGEGAGGLGGRVSWSSVDTNRAALAAQRRIGDVEISLFGVGLGGSGPSVQFDDMTRPRNNSPAPTPTGGATSGTDYERGANAGGQISWRGLTLQAQWNDRQKGLPSAPAGAIFDDPYNSKKDGHAFAELRYRLELGEAQAVTARAYYDRFRSREYLRRDPSDWEPDRWLTEDPHTVSEGNDDTMGAELRGELTLFESNTLIVGFEAQQHEITQPTYELDLASLEPVPESLAGGRKNAAGEIEPIGYTDLALYLQDEWRPLDELKLVAGLRIDHNSLFHQGLDAAAKELAPRVAAIWSPRDDASVKLMYGEAFRDPSVFESFYDDGASVCGNPDLHRERQRTLELAGGFEINKGLTAQASLFYMRISDLLSKQPIDPCYEGSGPRVQFVNAADLEVTGGEASLDLRQGDVAAFASITVAQVEQAGGAQSIPNSPSIVVSAGASTRLYSDWLSASGRAQYISERLNWTLDAERPEAAHLRVDVSLVARRQPDGLFGALTATNLLNASYRDPVSSNETIAEAIPQDGIALLIEVGHAW
jgi:outer membrane receptor for ferrienterochelin and colicins